LDSTESLATDAPQPERRPARRPWEAPTLTVQPVAHITAGAGNNAKSDGGGSPSKTVS
jgi:hypothetical protein